MPKIKPASVAFESTTDATMSGTDISECDKVSPVVIYFGSQSGIRSYPFSLYVTVGTAEAFSHIIHKELQTAGVNSEIEDLERFDPQQFKYVQSSSLRLYFIRLHRLVILVVATTGEGDATDNAKKFNKFITSKATPIDVFHNLKYAVFGLGDLNYINFNHMGKRTEINMDRLGATKIYPRGIGDASQDIEADLRRWIDGGLIDAIKESLPSLRRTGSKPVVVLHGIPDLLEMVHVTNPASARPISPSLSEGTTHGRDTLSKVFWTLKTGVVVSNTELRPKPSQTESTRKITLNIDSKYVACDSVEILPRNSADSVEETANLFEIPNLDQLIDFDAPSLGRSHKLPFPTPCTIREALTQFVDLSCAPSRTFISNLAILVRSIDPELEDALHAFANSQNLMRLITKGESLRVNCAIFLKIVRFFFPSFKISLGDYLQIAQKQRVRPYTGASQNSETRVDLIVSLTVDIIDDQRIGVEQLLAEMVSENMVTLDKSVPEIASEICKLHIKPNPYGLCSKYLCDIDENSKILYRVRESVLRPPTQIDSVVGICTGAGIAAGMAYIDHITSIPGGWSKIRNFNLVFGCRKRDADYLLTDVHPSVRLYTAFSRESDKKRYVQDVVREEVDIHKILANLNSKSRVVICGNTAMCRSVCEVIANQIGGRAQLEKLEKDGIVLVEYFGYDIEVWYYCRDEMKSAQVKLPR